MGSSVYLKDLSVKLVMITLIQNDAECGNRILLRESIREASAFNHGVDIGSVFKA